MQNRGATLAAIVCLAGLSGCGGDGEDEAAGDVGHLDSTNTPTNAEEAIAQCRQAAEGIADEGAKQTALEICNEGVEALAAAEQRPEHAGP